jgi:hypothetical protein
MMSAKTYRLRIAREGYEFEAEGDKAFVAEMFKRFGAQPGTEPPQPSASQKGRERPKRGENKEATSAPLTGAKSLSIREFIQVFSFKKHTDITVAFAYYLEKYSGVSDFTPADINNCYYEAKLDNSNTSQMIIQNIKSRRMMPSKKKSDKGKKKFYTLTSSGEEFIKSKLSGNS